MYTGKFRSHDRILEPNILVLEQKIAKCTNKHLFRHVARRGASLYPPCLPFGGRKWGGNRKGVFWYNLNAFAPLLGIGKLKADARLPPRTGRCCRPRCGRYPCCRASPVRRLRSPATDGEPTSVRARRELRVLKPALDKLITLQALASAGPGGSTSSNDFPLCENLQGLTFWHGKLGLRLCH